MTLQKPGEQNAPSKISVIWNSGCVISPVSPRCGKNTDGDNDNARRACRARRPPAPIVRLPRTHRRYTDPCRYRSAGAGQLRDTFAYRHHRCHCRRVRVAHRPDQTAGGDSARHACASGRLVPPDRILCFVLPGATRRGDAVNLAGGPAPRRPTQSAPEPTCCAGENNGTAA